MLSNLEPTRESTAGGSALPRRVAMVVRLFSRQGGLELYTHKLVEGLLARGIAVTVVCEENQSDFVHPSLQVRFFKAPERAAKKFERITHYYNAATTALGDLNNSSHSHQAAHATRANDLSHANAPQIDANDRNSCDIVHSQHLPVKGADVVTFHNHTVFRLTEVGLPWEASLNRFKTRIIPSYKLRETYDRALTENAACRLFSSRTCLDDFFETYGKAAGHDYASYMVAYPGAALSQPESGFQTNSQTIAPDPVEPFNFLFVGKGYRKKGLDVLLAACSILKRRGQRFNLLIAGLKAKPIDKLRLSLLGLDCVQYLGFQKDMQSVYDRSGAIVLPSRIEPFGMAPLQAMLNGLPPIVSRVSGIAELLEHGKDALILNDHLNAAELANHMESLLIDEELRTRLGLNGRHLAMKLTWDATVEATIQAYQYVLSKKMKEVTST